MFKYKQKNGEFRKRWWKERGNNSKTKIISGLKIGFSNAFVIVIIK